MAQKVGIPKGTRDFGPEEVGRRNFIFETLRNQFQLFGFQPIETPSFENLDTLTGKYGEEGDRLIFRILNSGDFAGKVKEDEWNSKDSKSLASSLSEKALRYDLTVPFARYVVHHQNEIQFPFKRYQMQPVWRADRPQKGRFREFTQCDADIVGSESLWNEVEFVSLYDQAFAALGFKGITLKVNNRKILSSLVEALGIQDHWVDFTVALDKLDKIGAEKVGAEMETRGIQSSAINQLMPLLKGEMRQAEIQALVCSNPVGKKGWDELRFLQTQIEQRGLKITKFEFDLTLARGLDYYTGAIFEVKAQGVEMGSIGGGGRYDDLTGVFGLKDVPGVGISFGVDRIYLVMEALNLFPAQAEDHIQIIFANFGDEESAKAIECIDDLRQAGIASALYPDSAKMKKQFAYADKLNIPFMALYGSSEIKEGVVGLKNLKSGEQFRVHPEQLVEFFKQITS